MTKVLPARQEETRHCPGKRSALLYSAAFAIVAGVQRAGVTLITNRITPTRVACNEAVDEMDEGNASSSAERAGVRACVAEAVVLAVELGTSAMLLFAANVARNLAIVDSAASPVCCATDNRRCVGVSAAARDDGAS